jgi:hypothetical protein
MSPDDYFPILILLNANMNFRGLAHVMSLFTEIDYATTYNDVLRVNQAGFHWEPKAVMRVRQRLVECGYNDWLTQE